MGFEKMRDRVQLLELACFGTSYMWRAVKNIWAKAEQDSKTNLFSKVGIGVESATFLIRKQAVTLHNAFRFNGEHYFLTAIKEIGTAPVYLEITAAKIEPVLCSRYASVEILDPYNSPHFELEVDCTFPACLVEKYLGHTMVDFHAETTTTYVLVAPKSIVLDSGQLVEIEDKKYSVTVCHTLDLYKNEYEIQRKEDC